MSEYNTWQNLNKLGKTWTGSLNRALVANINLGNFLSLSLCIVLILWFRSRLLCTMSGLASSNEVQELHTMPHWHLVSKAMQTMVRLIQATYIDLFYHYCQQYWCLGRSIQRDCVWAASRSVSASQYLVVAGTAGCACVASCLDWAWRHRCLLHILRRKAPMRHLHSWTGKALRNNLLGDMKISTSSHGSRMQGQSNFYSMKNV